MAIACCAENSNCCVFYRGTVYLRAIGDAAYRPVGNSSQFRIEHDAPQYAALNGDLDEDCCAYEAVTAQLALRCFDTTNLLLGFAGAETKSAATVVTDTINVTSAVNPGDLLPFSKIADTTTVVATGLPSDFSYTVTPHGLIAKTCIAGIGPIQISYTSLKSSTSGVGEACETIYECMYIGTNAFDGSSVIVKIPQVKWRSVTSFDWIGANADAAEMLLEGTLLPNASSPTWYSITRQDCSELCDCATPVITQSPTLPLYFEPGVAITPVVIWGSPATSVPLLGNLPTGITASINQNASSGLWAITLSGTPTVDGEDWAIIYTFTNACNGGNMTSTPVDLGAGVVMTPPTIGDQRTQICTGISYPEPAHPLNGGPNNRLPWLRIENADTLSVSGTPPTGTTVVYTASDGGFDVDLSGTPTVVNEAITLTLTASRTLNGATRTVTKTLTFNVATGCSEVTTISDLSYGTNWPVGITQTRFITIDNADSVVWQGDDPVPFIPTGTAVSLVGSPVPGQQFIQITGAATVSGEQWKMRVAAYNECGDCTSVVLKEFSGFVGAGLNIEDRYHEICVGSTYPEPGRNYIAGDPSVPVPFIRVTGAVSVTYGAVILPSGMTSIAVTQDSSGFSVNPVGVPTTAGQAFSVTVIATAANGVVTTKTFTTTVRAGCGLQTPLVGYMQNTSGVEDTSFKVGVYAERRVLVYNYPVADLSVAGYAVVGSGFEYPALYGLPTGLTLTTTRMSPSSILVTITGTPTIANEAWKLRLWGLNVCSTDINCRTVNARDFSGFVTP